MSKSVLTEAEVIRLADDAANTDPLHPYVGSYVDSAIVALAILTLDGADDEAGGIAHEQGGLYVARYENWLYLEDSDGARSAESFSSVEAAVQAFESWREVIEESVGA